MKVTNVEKTIEKIIELRYTKFQATGTIVKYLVNTYGLSEARSYELIRIARIKYGDMYYKTNEKVLEDAIYKMESMLEEATKVKNFKLALEIQKELNKVLELSKNEIKVDIKIEQPLLKPLEEDDTNDINTEDKED